MRAVENVLDPAGELHITQKDGAPYDGWRVDGSARWLRQLRAAAGFEEIAEDRVLAHVRAWPFDATAFVGYRSMNVDPLFAGNASRTGFGTMHSGGTKARTHAFAFHTTAAETEDVCSSSSVGSCDKCGVSFSSEKAKAAHLQGSKHNKVMSVELKWERFLGHVRTSDG